MLGNFKKYGNKSDNGNIKKNKMWLYQPTNENT